MTDGNAVADDEATDRADASVGVEPTDEVIEDLIEADDLLGVGSPFIPGNTPIPDYQFAWGINSDEDGDPNHGTPLGDGAEKELLIPVEDPGPNEALVYMLTSEVNYNDVWAVTGIPVSTFGNHDRDWHITGSGGLGIVADMGDGASADSRFEVGDLVTIYSGQYDAFSPEVGRDPMAANFRIHGYQTPDGSHQQFMRAQATQLFEPPESLDLEEAGSYLLTMGTIYRALFNTLDVETGSNLFVEGASTGTGRDTVVLADTRDLNITGLVSSLERGERALAAGADAYLDRKSDEHADAMRMVPHDADEWEDWRAAGEPLLDEFREKNDGDLADYVVSHAGQAAFSRSFQLLDDGGRLTFFGASTGYEMAFLGKGGKSTPDEVYDRTNLRPGQGVMIWYGTPDRVTGTEDDVGEAAIESALDNLARVAVVTATDAQAEHVESEYDVEGTVSIETLAEEDDGFEFVDSLPELPPPESPDLLPTVGAYSNKMFKPLGKAVGGLLRTPNNPRGNPDVVFERAGQNTLGVSTMLCAPFKGEVVYSEDMSGQRYSFYAPQVWMRQRRIIMPTTEIFGTHMKDPHEVMKLHEEIEQGTVDVPKTHLSAWEDTPSVHEDMWNNEHKEGSYVINHALPDSGLDSKEDLLDAWEN
jgi:acrylyl-CoA reductase (NADPH)/3-hydroxypropionyl-CoA dehydratase/3-hydroxypropionyl-CoA synthetase